MAIDTPEARLERALMEEYLADQGHSFDELSSIDEHTRWRLLREAARYASRRMAELEGW
jgi:hypothetical protein